MQEIIGSLPFPKDRLKILNFYQKDKIKRIKQLRKINRYKSVFENNENEGEGLDY